MIGNGKRGKKEKIIRTPPYSFFQRGPLPDFSIQGSEFSLTVFSGHLAAVWFHGFSTGQGDMRKRKKLSILIFSRSLFFFFFSPGVLC